MKRIIVFLLSVLSTAPAWAGEEPLWESGLGLGFTSVPDYRGSDEGHTYILPIPYFVYRGDRLHIDRRGIHGDIVGTNGFLLDLSIGLGPPAQSDDNAARIGMPDLYPTVEAGPSLRWRWYENTDKDRALSLNLPARAVVASNLVHTHYIGWVFSPNLAFDALNVAGGGWNLSSSIGPLYATEKYHDYFYEVKPQYATSTRPAYDARSGYSGSRLTLTMSKRFADFWLGGFMRYDALRNAAFEDSPLMRQSHSFMAGVGISWIFARSEETVITAGTADNP